MLGAVLADGGYSDNVVIGSLQPLLHSGAAVPPAARARKPAAAVRTDGRPRPPEPCF